MNWKKIGKYFIILLFLGTVILSFLANRNMKQIYGGLTEVVEYPKIVSPNKEVVITNVSILSPDGETFIPNQTIRINEGIISGIDSLIVPSVNAISIDGQNKFLIPGLIDAHVHLFKSQNDLLLYVANGVTTLRELIGDEDHLNWRKDIADGRIGPDMYITSPRLGSFGLVEGWWMNWTQGFNNIRDAEEAEAKVKNYAKKGYDGVKIYSFLNEEAYDAINEIAVSEGLDIVGHIPLSLELSEVFNSNQSDIAHLEEIMNAIRREFGRFENQEGANRFLSFVENRTKEIVPELRANNISVTTTLWLVESFVNQKFELDEVLRKVQLEYVNPGISEWDEMIPQGLGWLPNVNRYKMPTNLNKEELEYQKIFWTTYAEACKIILKILSKGGVKIMAGTDANLPPTVPGFSLHDELKAMVEAGLSSAQVLRSATAIPSDRLEKNTGRIIPGNKANLVLLEENPLLNIANTRRINTVILNGHVLDRNYLDDLLSSVKLANDNSRKIDINPFLNDQD